MINNRQGVQPTNQPLSFVAEDQWTRSLSLSLSILDLVQCHKLRRERLYVYILGLGLTAVCFCLFIFGGKTERVGRLGSYVLPVVWPVLMLLIRSCYPCFQKTSNIKENGSRRKTVSLSLSLSLSPFKAIGKRIKNYWQCIELMPLSSSFLLSIWCLYHITVLHNFSFYEIGVQRTYLDMGQ